MSRPDSRPEPPRRRGLCAFVGILLAVLGIPGLLGDGPGVRATALPAQQGARSGFTLMDPATTGGVTFTNALTGEAYFSDAVAHYGSGVALGDVDGDGLPYLYLCGLQSTNQLYRNLGQWRFEPVSIGEAACIGQRSTGALLVDLDGDGDPDLYVSNDFASPDRLWFNDGRGHFRAAPPPALRHTCFNSMGIDVADVDRDGFDDLLVVDLLATRQER